MSAASVTQVSLKAAFHIELSGEAQQWRTPSPEACKEAPQQARQLCLVPGSDTDGARVVCAAEEQQAAGAAPSTSSALRGLHYFWSCHFTGLFPACCQCRENLRLHSRTSKAIRTLLTSRGKEWEAQVLMGNTARAFSSGQETLSGLRGAA